MSCLKSSNLSSARPSAKPPRTGRLIALELGGRARWTPRDYAALAREGYMRNAIVHRAVRLTAESVGALAFPALRGRSRAQHASAARSVGAAKPARGRRLVSGSRQHASAACRQRLYRGGRHRPATAQRARALRPAPRSHEDRAGTGRLAASFRIHRRRRHRALRPERGAAADLAAHAV